MTDMLAKNLAYLLHKDRCDQTALAAKVEIGQPTINKWSKLLEKRSDSEPGFRSMMRLARGLGYSLDDLAYRDIAALGASRPSQPAQLDPDKLGHALTAVDSALSEKRLKGQLGKHAETLIYALAILDKHFQGEVSPAMRGAYDELVAKQLEVSLNGRDRAGGIEAEGGQEGGPVAATGKANRGGRKRGNS